MGGRGSSSGMVGSGSNPFPDSLVKATVYHGTDVPDITEFSTGGRESNGAIFFGATQDYVEEMAFIKWEDNDNEGDMTMYEAKLDIRNPMEVTLPGNQFGDPTVESKYIRQAKAAGNDSVIFHSNTGDSYYDDTFYAVFSPDQIKITNKRRII